MKFIVSKSNGPTVLFRISRVYELSNLYFTMDRISLQVIRGDYLSDFEATRFYFITEYGQEKKTLSH